MKQEFIGKELEVMEAKNLSLKGRKGKVLDETKETFVIREDNKKTVILKRGTTFLIDDKLINGDDILKRPEDRLKLK